MTLQRDFTEAALDLARRGFALIPLRPRSKRSLITRWPRLAVTDESQIREWWGQWPDANIGVVCRPSNLVVLDVHGREAWQALCAEHEVPSTHTLMATTPSGGCHLYFATPADTEIRSSSDRLGYGIDVWGADGYVVAPPSVCDTGQYRWLMREPIRPLPRSIIKLLSTRIVGASSDGPRQDIRDLPAYIQAALDEKTNQVIHASIDARISTLKIAAYELGRLVGVPGSELDRMTVEQALLDAGRARDLADTDIRGAIKSGLEAGIARPCPGSAADGSFTKTGSIPLDTEETKLDMPNETQSQNDTTNWRIHTLVDAYKPRPPAEYVVEGLFPLPSLSIVYGAPGTLKSMILLEMCACVAAGRPWLPPMSGRCDVGARTTLENPVLWCDFDNGTRRTHERVEAIARGRNLSADVPLNYVTMPMPWLDLHKGTEQLLDSVRDVGAKLVVVDNLGVVSGGADENSIDMIDVLKNCRSVAEKTRAAIVLIHHQRKSSGYAARAAETLRGHSSILAAIDLALLIEREEHAESVYMKSTKVRGHDVLPFGAQFTYEHRPGTEELATVKFYGLPVEDLTSDAAIRRAVLDELDGQELNKGDLSGAVKKRLPEVGTKRIGEQIDGLASDADISMKKGDHNAKLYSLPKEKD